MRSLSAALARVLPVPLLAGALLAGPMLAPPAVAAAAGTVPAAHPASATRATPVQSLVDGCGNVDVRDTAAMAALAKDADDVFVGVVQAVSSGQPSAQPTGQSSAQPSGQPSGQPSSGSVQPTTPGAGPAEHRVQVLQVLAGEGLVAGQEVDIVFLPHDAAARAEDVQLRLGQSYVFLTRTGSGSVLEADDCTGYAPANDLDAASLAALREALAPTSADVELRVPDGASDAPELGRLVAPGAAICLIGLLGWVLVTRMSRR
ncbi:PT domain-containing protein [Nocardioides sp. zg-ZUI104]|uniref:PT domain-containing protein n=1 Tax=Nocardioides faecalis TaxID=2803858 RepID=UPI001BD102A0|nr:PT domain-containing protein [Nocardioides faecalis]MBS4753020.1 PT domain-containing protein [Nocardioides faecalis]